MGEEKFITDLETCLMSLGVYYPFNSGGKLSDEGYRALDKLRELLIYMQECGVVDNFNEDKLDRLISENAY